MCGLFAAFDYADRKLNLELCRRSVDAVLHRGPDFGGEYSDKHCFLGHRRLTILGLESASNQPFMFEELVMVYNGEVFNYLELRSDLEKKGYDFYTNSDTEVLLKAYHCWGTRAFSMLNGMWALVIYDRSSKRVVVSRDRFGQKPLFYSLRGSVLYFFSEPQQLRFVTDLEADHEIIQRFLKEGTYRSDGRTFFKGVYEFPKAHYSEIDDLLSVRTQRFWQYWNHSVREAVATDYSEFENLLKNAVEIRLRSDVPFGVLLSGGVDSTIIAAYAKEKSGETIRIPAFTYSSKDSRDETKFAEIAAARLAMPLTAREQDQVPQEYRARLMQLVRKLGRGHSSPAIVSVDYLYESVSRSKIKVALDGQGADELLAGYKNYFMEVIPWYLLNGKYKDAWYAIADQWKFGVMRSVIIWLRIILPPWLKKVGRLFYGYERFFRSFQTSSSGQLIRKKPEFGRNEDKLNRLLISQHDQGLENLLFYGDIVAMNNSVENRSPFMDHRLVDFAFSRDASFKLKFGVDKHVLRSLPVYEKFSDILNRPKVGFSSDIRPETKKMMISELETSQVLDWPIFRHGLRKFIKSGGFSKYKYERLLFRLYQVHLWNEIFIRDQAVELAD